MVLSAAISSFVSFLIFMASSLSLLRKGLLMCLNLVDCIILSVSFSNSFNSSTGGGFLVDFKKLYVSLGLLIVPGLRKNSYHLALPSTAPVKDATLA